MNAPVKAHRLGVADIARGKWFFPVTILALCFFALGAIFQEEVAGALLVWTGSATYNHCFLIVPIALYMIWRRRDSLADVQAVPDFRAAPLIVLLSLGWFAASVLAILEARQFAVVTIAQAMLLGVLGGAAYRRLAAPFLYLYFLVPSGDYLIPALQDFTGRFAVTGIHLLGIPVYSDGTTIEIPAGTFTVAEACAGLRFLVASVALGVFYATEIYDSWLRRTIFIALCVIVPIIANGLRAFGLLATAQAFGSAAAVEADHVTYGLIFFSVVLVSLIFIGRSFSDKDWDTGTDSLSTAAQPTGATTEKKRLAAAGVFCAGLAATGPAVGAALDLRSMSATLSASSPAVSAPWQRVAEAADWAPVVIGADRRFGEAFTDGETRVDRFVALYIPRGRGDDLIRSDNRIANSRTWVIRSRSRAVATIGGESVPVNAAVIVSGARHTPRLVVLCTERDDGGQSLGCQMASGPGVLDRGRLSVGVHRGRGRHGRPEASGGNAGTLSDEHGAAKHVSMSELMTTIRRRKTLQFSDRRFCSFF